MIGGGFGGSVLALVPAAAGGPGASPGSSPGSGPVRDAVTAAFARHGWTAPEFLDAAPSDSARQLSG
jgi:galactokinase